MTAVAAPPSFANISRPAWGLNGNSSLHSMNPHSTEDARGMFTPRKNLQRTNSSSSVSSTSSTASSGTVTSSSGSANSASSSLTSGDLASWNRKRPQTKGQWSQGQSGLKADGPDYSRMPVSRPLQSGINGASSLHQAPMLIGGSQASQQGSMGRPLNEPMPTGQPVLYLLSLNGTFERKTISVPFYPDTLRIGRQTNARTVPTPLNGYFDSKVLSRQHAEIYADRQGKIWIRDVKSSNGTFVNGTRLSQENRESEPHELQTQDHLELGIDIVNEDQRSVMHHKVAAKVEHAGFLSTSQNLMDMSFGDLDPAGGQMMLQQVGGITGSRGRTGTQSSLGSNGRMAATNGVGHQGNGITPSRGMWMNQPSTEIIVKKLHQEMRIAKLQANDLQRTAQFLNSLLGKEDIKNSDKPEVPEPPKQSEAPKQNASVNGNGGLFRQEFSKTRFSDPPAPPPQQPLPEKPDVARPNGDVPPLKRATTERPKSHPTTTSPIRQDNLSQIIQLTETLNNAKKELDSQSARIRDLEEMVQKEREARESAEDLVKKLEDAASAHMNGAARSGGHETLLEETFEPPTETVTGVASPSAPGSEASTQEVTAPSPPSPPGVDTADSASETVSSFHARMEAIVKEMRELRQELDATRERAEKAEAERDSDRQTLIEMVIQIRQKDEDIKRLVAVRKSRSRSGAPSTESGNRGRKRSFSAGVSKAVGAFPATPTTTVVVAEEDGIEGGSGAAPSSSKKILPVDGATAGDLPDGQPTLSRANTITPSSGSLAQSTATKDQMALQAAPYASMIGVVLIGMGLMAWINGWQQPRLDR